MVYCTAVGCNNNQLSNTTFHRYPKDPELRRQWLERAGRSGWKPSTTSVLCGEHFDRDCFNVMDTHSDLNLRTKKSLKPDAIPTIFNYSQLFDPGDSEATNQSNSSDYAEHGGYFEVGI